MEERRVLIIDDSELALELERGILEARGYEVRATQTLMEFERVLADFEPHLILADINMPEVQGTDICRALKREYQTQDLPVVLFSSLPEDELRALAARVGADGYLSKTSGLEALGEKVDELFESILW